MANISTLFGIGGIKSVQQGTISVTTNTDATVATNTASLGTTVTTSKAFVLPLGCTGEINTINYKNIGYRLALTDGSTVTASVNNANGIVVTVGYTVVEFA